MRTVFTGLLIAMAGAPMGHAQITLLNDFNQGWGQPGQLTEVASGAFAGLAMAPAAGARAFLLSSQGALSSLYTFPANAYPLAFVQALNGRLYGTERAAPVGFSLRLSGDIQTYSIGGNPILSIPALDQSVYGTEYSLTGENTFVRVSLNGGEIVVHQFSAQEGLPYGQRVLASDDNFYGIAGLGDVHGLKSAMVYRLTHQGELTILADYPDGRRGFRPGKLYESLIEAGDGNLYGTAALGGAKRAGAIFTMAKDGTGYRVLHEFRALKEGAPTVLVSGTDGHLYGIGEGAAEPGGTDFLFRIDLQGTYERLQAIDPEQTGSCPCTLSLGSDGRFYGTAATGGPGMGSAWIWDVGMPKPKPQVVAFSPAGGSPGTVVTIWGKQLLGATAVSFNGTPATVFGSMSKAFVSATVPSGATTGLVTVTTPNGTAHSPRAFTVN